jgi:hypothetical protein
MRKAAAIGSFAPFNAADPQESSSPSSASPFGLSSCADMKTMFWRHAATVLDGAGNDDVPGSLRPEAAHTHNALDDAVEQAELFVNLWRADEQQHAEKPERRILKGSDGRRGSGSASLARRRPLRATPGQ